MAALLVRCGALRPDEARGARKGPAKGGSTGMAVFATLAGGHTLPVEVDASATVADLRAAIVSAATTIPDCPLGNHSQLFFSDTELAPDSATLADLGVGAEATVEVRGGTQWALTTPELGWKAQVQGLGTIVAENALTISEDGMTASQDKSMGWNANAEFLVHGRRVITRQMLPLTIVLCMPKPDGFSHWIWARKAGASNGAAVAVNISPEGQHALRVSDSGITEILPRAGKHSPFPGPDFLDDSGIVLGLYLYNARTSASIVRDDGTAAAMPLPARRGTR
eukprot:TRINITY_DN55744_c0_g1_i1.p1 TRINITY_DN55744_c0_g1~~TRINITY_DN55744_c0_g1_i1.p1  ORF type:complete len:308 (+),score=76.56 TRINITY_DN55744_c0_g1_i1:83-925(+)